MADGGESYTQRLSRALDSAYEAYKAGEPGSDLALYEAFLAQARNVIWQKLRIGDGNLEYDIAHRAFIALGDFREESLLSTWFFTIARNESNRALRKIVVDRRDRVAIDPALDPDTEIPGFEPPAASIDPDAPLEIAAGLQKLPPEQAEVIRLHIEGFTLEEIAEKMGAPLGTTRGRYTLAKAKMARK